MNRHSITTAQREGKSPYLPNGKRVGRYITESGVTIWERKVKARHVLRQSDSYTINEGILRQLRADRVVMVRYIADEGVYEISLSEFSSHSIKMPDFACGETVYALPRGQWRYMPSTKLLGLFDCLEQT